MRATEFLGEAPADEISADLNQIGLSDQRRDSAKTVSVYVPLEDRLKIMQQIEDKLPDAVWDKTYSNSSVGAIRYKGGTVRVRPKGKAGKNSAGLGNEQTLINEVKNAIEAAGGSVNIVFKGSNGVEWTVEGCTGVKGVGDDVAGRKKADVVFNSSAGTKRASIKKGNAMYWESADTYFGKEADDLIGELVQRGDVELIPLGKKNSAGKEFVKLSREIAAKATMQEITDVIFGNDLVGPNGAVLKQTFTPSDFQLNGQELVVNCKEVMIELKDVPKEAYVYFLIRNDGSRGRPKYKYPGIRSTAVYRKRLSNNTLKVNRGK